MGWARIISARPIDNQQSFSYWSSHKFAQGYVSLVGYEQPINWRDWSSDLVGGDTPVSHYANPLQQSESWLVSNADKIELIVFTTPHPSGLPSSLWLQNAFNHSDLDQLASVMRGEQGNQDCLLCACFSTSRKAIERARENGASTSAELSAALGCGSKCGSCLPELNNLLHT